MRRNIVVPVLAVGVLAAVILALALTGGDEDSATPQASTSPAAATAPVEAPGTTTGPETTSAPRVVTKNARRLGPPGTSGVTFTEFLDFECEACRAAFPAIEKLRARYTGRITFNIRYFPLPSHTNAENSAVAVEAAAQQGKLEAMYRKMYETQGEWGEASESKASVFRGFARELKLDMARYDAAVRAPATLARVRRESALGQSLGVQSTPTFFLDERMIQPQSIEELEAMLEEAAGAS